MLESLCRKELCVNGVEERCTRLLSGRGWKIIDLHKLVDRLSKHIFYPTDKELRYDEEDRLINDSDKLIYKNESLSELIRQTYISLGDYDHVPEVLTGIDPYPHPNGTVSSLLRQREIDTNYYSKVKKVVIISDGEWKIKNLLNKSFNSLFSYNAGLYNLRADPEDSELSDKDGYLNFYEFFYSFRDSPVIDYLKKVELKYLITTALSTLFASLPNLEEIVLKVPEEIEELLRRDIPENKYKVTYLPNRRRYR